MIAIGTDGTARQTLYPSATRPTPPVLGSTRPTSRVLPPTSTNARSGRKEDQRRENYFLTTRLFAKRGRNRSTPERVSCLSEDPAKPLPRPVPQPRLRA